MPQEPCFQTRQQIAQHLGVSRSTFYRMLQEAGITLPPRRMLSPQECRELLDKLRAYFEPVEFPAEKSE